MKRNIWTYIIVFILVATSITGWLSVVRFIINKNAELQARRIALAQNEQTIDDARSVRSYSTERQVLLSAIQNRFVDAQTVVRFIEELEAIAKTAGVKIDLGSVSMSTGDRKPSFNFSINGSFQNIFHYITLLEHVPYEINIANIDISSMTSGWSARIQADLKSFIG